MTQTETPGLITAGWPSRSQIRRHLDARFGSRRGRVHFSFGSDPYITDTGKYEHRTWSNHSRQWPDEVELVETEIHQEAHLADVYVALTLMRGDRRRREEALTLEEVHCDVDGGLLDLDKARQLGATVIASGSPGNGHVEISLAHPVTPAQHRAIQCGVVEFLDADPSKVNANDLLRIAGTFNFKRTVYEPGSDPSPVEFLIEPDGTRVDPAALAALVGIELPAADRPDIPTAPGPRIGAAAPFALADFPCVREALHEVTSPPDRSKDHHRVVAACYNSGLTLDQARHAINSRPDLAGRISERNDDDVLTSWIKIDADRRTKSQQHVADTEALFILAGSSSSSTTALPAVTPQLVVEHLGDQADLVAQKRERLITERLQSIQIDAEARRRHAEACAPTLDLPPVRTLEDLLAEPDTDTAYRVDRLAPAGGRVLLSAQYKAGKSTLRDNLVRSLVDGDPFVGAFPINTLSTGLVLMDNELSEHTLRRWLRKTGIRNTAAVADVVALRGRVGTFNILDDRTRSQWARRFRDAGADYLILDCLRPVLDALGLDENRDAGRFLVAFDALLDEAGISDALVVHHMGHANERARGDSRLQDWPDAIWRLVRADPDDPASARFFTAYGRDVDIPEGRLDFDDTARSYTYVEGSRKANKAGGDAGQARAAVINILAEHGRRAGAGMSQREVIEEANLKHGVARQAVKEALRGVLADELVALRPGARNALLHSIRRPCRRCGFPIIGETDNDTHRNEKCAKHQAEQVASGLFTDLPPK